MKVTISITEVDQCDHLHSISSAKPSSSFTVLPVVQHDVGPSPLSPATSSPSRIMRLSLMSPAILVLLALPTLSAAWSWRFDTTPQQCKDLSISISGSGGKPPYRLLILPFGPTPLPNNIEARRIIDKSFPADANSLSFKLNYPGLSQFVAVVSFPKSSVCQ